MAVFYQNNKHWLTANEADDGCSVASTLFHNAEVVVLGCHGVAVTQVFADT